MRDNRLLYFSPSVSGGLADYAHEQANALAQFGLHVELLSSKDFPTRRDDNFELKPLLPAKPPGKSKSRLMNRLANASRLLGNYHRLARIVENESYSHVLLGSYAEYLSPIWSRRLFRLSERGVVFGAIVHDPVRDYVVGPLSWHRRSVAAAYSFLREAFVHEPIVLDTVRPMPRLRTSVVPHGILPFPPATKTRAETHRHLGIPDSAHVWLSFGHIRDGKNLDLVIRALDRFPDAVLLVAGKEQSSGQKPVSFYRDLARECGVSHRCFWLNRFIAKEEVGNLFNASDLALLTYSKSFRSASGVLNTAIYFRKPCLASSGQGNLQTMVSKYGLGVFVEPDNVPALIEGIDRVRHSPPAPAWEKYETENSWQRNAEIVSERMFHLDP